MRIRMLAGAIALSLHTNAAPAVEVGLELVADGLTQPVALVSPPGDERRFIVEQTGQIRILSADGELLKEPFLDIGQRLVELDPQFDERGLLGLAFDPAFAENGRFYVYYSAPLRADTAHPGWNHTSRISEFRVSTADPDRADLASERVILEIDQPRYNHNAGWLAFGPDGYLYIALGDGGLPDEEQPPEGFAQKTDTLLGKILRIDVSGHPYRIVADNPFVGDYRYRPEIYALGFRNPYRCAFDAGGDRSLLCSDVGHAGFEEVSIVRAGGNYGWREREGRHCYDPKDPWTPAEDCSADGFIEPVIEYGNCSGPLECAGRAIIGGYVYRGDAVPALSGRYVFGDWSAVMDGLGPSLFAASPAGGEALWPIEPIEVTDMRFHSLVLGFGQDAEGEIYVLASRAVGPRGTDGKIYKIVPSEHGPPVGRIAASGQAAGTGAESVTVVE